MDCRKGKQKFANLCPELVVRTSKFAGVIKETEWKRIRSQQKEQWIMVGTCICFNVAKTLQSTVKVFIMMYVLNDETVDFLFIEASIIPGIFLISVCFIAVNNNNRNMLQLFPHSLLKVELIHPVFIDQL
jgi:hypothetical protein